MPSTCFFEFDRRGPIYYSGETIKGRVILTTTSRKSVNEIYIHFEGEAKVRWTEQRTRTFNMVTKTRTDRFRGKETYLDTQTNVFGSGELPAGTYIYKFCVPLPLWCPSSVVGKYGKISYEISLVIDRQSSFNNIFKQPLTVLQTYNLNMSPLLMMPLVHEDVKHFCCWPCSSGPVFSTLTVPFGGYAPGQRIHFTLEIVNQSARNDLSGIEVCLKQRYKLCAQHPHYKTHEIENILHRGSVEERVLRLSQTIIHGTLQIPSVPPSSRNDGIISVDYRIILTINMGNFAKNTNFNIPIVIGTIPLIQSAENPSRAAEWIPETPDTPPDSAADLPPSYDNCKPPPFEEATRFGDHFIDIDADEHNRTDDFLPRYPMYTDFAQPSAPPPPEENEDVSLMNSVPVLSLPPSSTAPSRPPNANENTTNYGWNT
ncbi:arrestin domain-containing protein 3-like [Drosophila bipectinata]|uniref:arrestin domain-containing protein 3-like n=1 Tax=Drosophila bipectinata TaxID=42026 RepID=UPI001C8A2591|nr:arrestin domain-containing protein 3-like isoform X3 [Drosophila bipectinata]